ncbi:MAG: hypothetical protein ACMXYE_02515 [Candidatus Woesearchaeota archaeon]
MVDESLLNYLKQQLANGYSRQQLTDFLVQRGYPIETLNECFDVIYDQHPRAEPSHSRHLFIPLVLIVIVFLGIIGTITYIIFSPAPQGELQLQFQIQPTMNEFENTITLRRTAESDSDRAIPVTITYQIYNANNEQVHQFEESMLLSAQDSSEVPFTIPDVIPGRYRVSATISHRDVTETAETHITIAERDTQPTPQPDPQPMPEPDPEPDQCPLYIEERTCMRSRCGPDTDFRVVYEDIVPCCGNNICEAGETPENCPQDCQDPTQTGAFNYSTDTHLITFINDETIPITSQIESIRELSETRYNDAMELCDAIVYPYYKNMCFYEVADQTGNAQTCTFITVERDRDRCHARVSQHVEDSSVCDEITSALRRDSCYMRFALQGDYSVCDKLEDAYYVESCRNLKELGQMAPDAVAEYALGVS